MDASSRNANTFLKYYSYVFNILLVATYIGIEFSAPTWMTTFDYYLKMCIGIFLVYRFNSFRTIVFEELDRRVAFSAGMILITSTIMGMVFAYLPKYTIEISKVDKTNNNDKE
jgi:hypothetical protein